MKISNMETKEIKITPPEGFEIDKENSTFECIKFKPVKKKRWKDDEDIILSGYYITSYGSINEVNINEESHNIKENFNIFATEKQAKSALAMARISQILTNDKRFGGIVTDKEWNNTKILKYIVARVENRIFTYEHKNSIYCFLAFHTEEQRDLFLAENEDLVRDYLMID